MKTFLALDMGKPEGIGKPMPQMSDADMQKGMTAWG